MEISKRRERKRKLTDLLTRFKELAKRLRRKLEDLEKVGIIKIKNRGEN